MLQKLPPINTNALHVFIPGEDRESHGSGIRTDNHLLNGKIWGSKNNSCTRQSIKHDGITNPPMVFDTSGSPVIYKECGKDAVHGLHGNGMDFDGYMNNYNCFKIKKNGYRTKYIVGPTEKTC